MRIAIQVVAVLMVATFVEKSAIAEPPAFPIPTPAVHAHNDYEHDRPLLDALDAGARSVEADIHLIDGQLLVAHDADKTTPQRTLSNLYFAPLRKRIAENNGSVYGDGAGLLLLIDFKGKSEEIYPVLLKSLAEFKDLLTIYSPEGQARYGPITVVLTGNRPRAEILLAEATRLCALDGSLADLDKNPPPPASLVPLISANWKQTFKWKGTGPMPDEDRVRMTQLATKAHQQGRKIRFWGGPDVAAAWDEQLRCGVDWINTDHLREAAASLKSFVESGAPRPLAK